MARTRKSQSDHNKTVEQLANKYKRSGYDVAADIPGWTKPPTIRGYRPDLIAEKGKEKTVVEVETPDSLGSARDKGQQLAFKNWATQSEKKHFKKVVTK